MCKQTEPTVTVRDLINMLNGYDPRLPVVISTTESQHNYLTIERLDRVEDGARLHLHIVTVEKNGVEA